MLSGICRETVGKLSGTCRDFVATGQKNEENSLPPSGFTVASCGSTCGWLSRKLFRSTGGLLRCTYIKKCFTGASTDIRQSWRFLCVVVVVRARLAHPVLCFATGCTGAELQHAMSHARRTAPPGFYTVQADCVAHPPPCRAALQSNATLAIS